MQIKPIRTENDYLEALKTVEGLMSAEFGSEEGDQLDVLTTLIEAYERRVYPIGAADPIESIKFDTAEYLDNDEVIAEYLAASLEESTDVFLEALATVARARGMTQRCRDAGFTTTGKILSYSEIVFQKSIDTSRFNE